MKYRISHFVQKGMDINMEKISVRGKNLLNGSVQIQGSKNATLPIIAATLLIEEPCLIENCPDILDVDCSVQLLKEMGARVCRTEGKILFQNRTIRPEKMTLSLMQQMRSSITMAGPLLARCKDVILGNPGGCVIGKRPIDIHIEAFMRMGACVEQTPKYIHLKAKRLYGVEHILPIASVGATENIIMAATLAEGRTIIRNSAKEPEIVALCDFLNSAGAMIFGAGSEQIVIEGVPRLHGCNYRVPADRIVAGTFLSAVLACGGSIFLDKAPWQDMERILFYAKQMGAAITLKSHGVQIEMRHRPYPIRNLATGIYPGFPTDMQSLFMVPLCLASGFSVIEENVFENRYHIVSELQKMGANIWVRGKKCYISGVECLHGDKVTASELRGAAALIVAGLAAEGKTTVDGLSYFLRGYANFFEKINSLGGDIVLEKS